MALLEAEMQHIRDAARADRALLVEVRNAVQANREVNIKITAYAAAILGVLEIVLASLKYWH
jgi:hypothetical protein